MAPRGMAADEDDAEVGNVSARWMAMTARATSRPWIRWSEPFCSSAASVGATRASQLIGSRDPPCGIHAGVTVRISCLIPRAFARPPSRQSRACRSGRGSRRVTHPEAGQVQNDRLSVLREQLVLCDSPCVGLVIRRVPRSPFESGRSGLVGPGRNGGLFGIGRGLDVQGGERGASLQDDDLSCGG